MSKTLEVYPRSSQTPSFQQLLDLATIRTHEQLRARGVAAKPELAVALRTNQTHEVLPLDLSLRARWNSSEYAWFSVKGVPGGTDVSCWTINSDDLEYWEYLTSEHSPAMAVRDEVLACLANGSCWSFRRSAGQPGVIAFVYGMLAAAMAELTDGFVFSDDAAWDYERFPAKAHEVYEWYFNPEKAIDPDFAKWAKDCLAAISSESGANPSGQTSHHGKTIDELFPNEPADSQRTDFKATPEMFAELRAKPQLRVGYGFSLALPSGTFYEGRTNEAEHGFGFSVVWNSHRPQPSELRHEQIAR